MAEKTPFSTTTPILGLGELGTEVSSVTLTKADKEEVREIEKALKQHVPDTLAVIKKRESERRAGRIQKAVEGLQSAFGKLHAKLEKAQEDAAQGEYDASSEAIVDSMAREIVSKSMSYGAERQSFEQAKADVWLRHPELVKRFEEERRQKQQVLDIEDARHREQQ
jgi:hypothetical protein